MLVRSPELSIRAVFAPVFIRIGAARGEVFACLCRPTGIARAAKCGALVERSSRRSETPIHFRIPGLRAVSCRMDGIHFAIQFGGPFDMPDPRNPPRSPQHLRKPQWSLQPARMLRSLQVSGKPDCDYPERPAPHCGGRIAAAAALLPGDAATAAEPAKDMVASRSGV